MSFADSFHSSSPPQRNPRNTNNNNGFSLDIVSNRRNNNNNDIQGLSNSIANEIRQISTNVTQIDQITRMLGSNRDNISLRDELNSLINSTRELAKETTENLKLLDSSDKSQERKIVQQKLTKDLSNWVKRFQEVYKVATEKERSTPIPSNNNQNNNKKGKGVKSYQVQQDYEDDDDDEKKGLMDSHRTEAQFRMVNQVEFNNQLIHSRDQDIKEIEKNVMEVNEIFRDISALVVEQGEMIDSIESNIEASVDHTTKGVEEIRKASTYQKSSRNKLCCLALIILIVCAVGGLLIWLFGFHKL